MSTLPRSERWAFFDCFAGISGDMTLGALIDLGLPVEELQGLLPALGLAGVSLTARRVTKQHLTGVKVEIEAGAHQPARTYTGDLRPDPGGGPDRSGQGPEPDRLPSPGGG